jgi:hypothetical protein
VDDNVLEVLAEPVSGDDATARTLTAADRVDVVIAGQSVATRDLYRTRFGMESRYRQLGEARPRTSPPDSVARRLWVAIGLVIRNAWVWADRLAGPRWSLGMVRLVLVVDVLVVFTRSTPTAGDRRPPPDGRT